MGILTVDRSLAVRAWDDWIAQATGISAAEAHGRPIDELIPSLAGRGLLDRFRTVLETGQVQVLAPTFHRYLFPSEPQAPSARFEHMQQRVTLAMPHLTAIADFVVNAQAKFRTPQRQCRIPVFSGRHTGFQQTPGTLTRCLDYGSARTRPSGESTALSAISTRSFLNT